MTGPEDFLGDTVATLSSLRQAYDKCDGSAERLADLHTAVGAFLDSFTRTDREIERQQAEIRLEQRAASARHKRRWGGERD